MDPFIFTNVEVVPERRTEYVSCWKMIKGHSEVFHRMQVAPERDCECH